MSTPSTNCPKCGAELADDHCGVIDYECDSWFGKTKSEFHQSEKCINNTLRTSLDKAKDALRYAEPILERFAKNYHKIAVLNTKTGEHHCGKEALRRASAVLKEIESV